MSSAPETLPGTPLFEFLLDERINLFTTLPSVLSTLPLDRELPELLTQTLGGEACPAELANHWGRGRRIFNGYGPTEATICATIATQWDLNQPPPIGRPIANTQIHILDESWNPVPINSPGEVYIGGVGVARGYLHQPDLTAERFVPDPFGNRPGARLYRTGDQARWRPEGNIEFLGRIDEQIKLRGYRIELGEIEAVLGQHLNVRHAVVMARHDGQVEKRLVAYVVAQREPAPSVRDLRRFVTDRLPDYMAPSAFVFLPEMPLTANGKADRKALPAPAVARSELDEEYVAPRDSAEESVAAIWARVLGIDRVGVHDNFFELGGNSLLATQAVARMREALGRDVPLRALFEAPTIAGLSQQLDELERRDDTTISLRRIAHGRDLPLSFAQHRLWFVDQLEPGNPLYNLHAAMRLRGPLDVAVLERCLREIIRRHDVLRTTFATNDGQAVQVVHPPVDVHITIHDLSHLPPDCRETKAFELAHTQTQKPFDLARGPLIRPTLVRLADDDHLLLPTMHHAVSDAWSLAIFTRELAELYEAFADGRPSPLAELPIQYADFADWQRRWLQGDVLETQLAYWRERLAHLPHALELPTDKPRPAVQRYHGDQFPFTVPRELLASLERFSLSEGVTLYMLLLAAYQALLARYSGKDDIVVGSPVAARNRPEIENLIGFFVNILVLRADLSNGPTFREFLRQVRETCLGAFAHQDVPFEKLVDELKPDRDLSRTPLFQAAFILQNAPPPTLRFKNVTISQVDVDQGTAKADISLSMTVADQGLLGRFVYNTDLFEADTIARMARHFETLLAGIVSQPAVEVAELPMMPSAERQKVLVDWNSTAADYPRDRCFHQLFEMQARVNPAAIALSFRESFLSYAELDQKSNQLAHYLQSLGVGPERVVAISMDRSIELVIGILGVLKAGGAYLPLDPRQPTARLDYILKDADVRVVLTHASVAAEPPNVQVVNLDRDAPAISRQLRTPPKNTAAPGNLVYVIYTSGSTGKPKGVLVEHRGLVNVITAQNRAFEIGPKSRLLQWVPIYFDAAQGEIARALIAGATLCLAPADDLLPGEPLLNTLRSQRITAATLHPSAPTAILDTDLPDLQTLAVGGEACPAELAQRWTEGRRFFNGYGPTEATICATLATAWEPEHRPPIGRPIANAQVYVLDAHFQPVPIGVPGELYIGGDGVARGYLHLPDQTAASFIPDPFSGRAGARLYRTGDRVRWTPDGQLDFMGRADDQVKVRGFRIELGEIEATLRQHPSVKENVVLAREDAPGIKQLVAYVVKVQEMVNSADLRDFLSSRLPDYMVPTTFVFLPSLPCLAHGKVDRKALPAPDRAQLEPGRPFVAPRTEREAELAAIWASILRRETIGVHDNFFTLGGDSISSIQVIARANRAGMRLTAKDLFQHQTIAELAAAAESATKGSEPLHDLQAELAYWKTALSPEVRRLLRDADFAGDELSYATLTTVVEPIVCEELLNDNRRRVEEVLLTALLQAIEAWTGQRSVLVDVDVPATESQNNGYGETAAFPIRFDLGDSGTPGQALQVVKEQIRAVPNGGRGFASLMKSGDATIVQERQALPRAEIYFGYLRRDTGEKGHLLAIHAGIENGGLRLDWTYRPELHHESTIQTIAHAFISRLRALVEHCRDESGIVSAADFPEARMSDDDLEALLSQIGTGEEDNV